MGVVELALACALLVACVLLAAALWRLRAARRHRQLLDHLPQTVVAAFDRELRVTLAAGAGLALGERRAEDIVGSFLLGDVPQAEREPLLIHYRAALRGERRSFEYRSAKTGRDYWVRLVPLTDRHGEITGGLSVALDLSGLRQHRPRPRAPRGRGHRGHRRDPGARAQRRQRRCPDGGMRGRARGRRRTGRRSVRALGRRQRPGPEGLRGRGARRPLAAARRGARLHARLRPLRGGVRRRRRVRARGRPGVHAPRPGRVGALASGRPRPGGARSPCDRLATPGRRRLAEHLVDGRAARCRGRGGDLAR